MRRIRRGVVTSMLVLSMLMSLAIGAPTANAVSLDTVSGGQTGLFVPLTMVQKLGNAGIFASPIPPAYLTFTSLQEGPAIRFPVSGGLVESATMLGTVNHAGGIEIQRQELGTGTVQKRLPVNNVRIVNGNQLIGDALNLVPSPTADLVNATWTKDPSTGVITYEADAQVNIITATVLNTYFSTDVFTGGMVLGKVRSTIQTKPLL